MSQGQETSYFSDFLGLVKIALFTTDMKERSEGEQKLLAFRDSSIDLFFLQSGEGLSSETIDIPLRQACGILLKRCIGLNSQQSQCSFWLTAKLETKSAIKNQLLSLLVHQNTIIRRSAADVISGICAIELPRKEWTDLINTLVQNTAHKVTDVRQASVLTLGFICEALKGINKKDCIDPAESEKILFGICQCMKKEETDVNIKLQAVKALQNSIGFMEQLFVKKDVRDFVTNVLFENAVHENVQIKISALQCMIDYSKQLYCYLNEYIQGILVVTGPSIKHKDPNIAIPAIEIWTVIGNETKLMLEKGADSNKRANLQEAVIAPNPLVNIYQHILPLLIENLLRNDTDENDDDDDETTLSVQETAFKASAAVAEAIGQQCHSIFTTFIQNTIHSQEWQQRKASILGFGALVEGSENDQVRSLVMSALYEIVTMLKDSNKSVKQSSARILARVAENYPETFLLNQNSLQILEIVLETTQGPPKLSKYSLWLISYLTENLSKFPQSPVSAQYNVILKILAQTTARSDLTNQDTQIINLAFVGILNIMHSIEDAQLLLTFLDEFFAQFQASGTTEDWRKEAVHSGLLSVMHGCIVRLTVLSSKQLNISIPHSKLEQIYKAVVNYFRVINDVSSDGIYLVSAIATYMKSKFSPFCREFIPYLSHSIQKVQDPDTFKATIYSLADIARAIGEEFMQYLPILDFFIKCISEQNLDRELKLHVYSCMADIVYGVGKQSLSCSVQVMSVLKIGFQASIKLALSSDTDLQDYSDRLKEVLIQSYTSILHAYNNTNQPFLGVYESLPWFYEALQALCDPQLKPTVEFVRSSLNCLADFASFYKQAKPQEMQALITSELVLKLRATLQRFSSQTENQDTIAYTNYISQQFSVTLSQN